MGRRGKNQKKSGKTNPLKVKLDRAVGVDDMNDEIDAFHKQRDKIPLDINNDVGESDDDYEHPVFDYKGINDDTDEDDEDEEDEEDEGDDENDVNPRGLTAKSKMNATSAKILGTQKYLRSKFGDADDEMHDDAEVEEEKKIIWGGQRRYRYGHDVDDELLSSDEDSAAEEEEEAMRLAKERVKHMSEEDFGIQGDKEGGSDDEPTFEDILVKGKDLPKKISEDDINVSIEEVKKDLNALSREEQMDVVHSSAPELVGLLSELNNALEELENKVHLHISKVEKKNAKKERMHFLEVKQLLLLSYCQAITFYLLLKSEGQPVRDHPVIARLVEIKSLLEKMKELEVNLPSEFDGSTYETVETANLSVKGASFPSDPMSEGNDFNEPLSEEQETSMLQFAEEPQQMKMNITVDSGSKLGNKSRKNEQVSLQSSKMLKVRSELEAKLKQKGIFSSIETKVLGSRKRKLQPINGRLETFDDFDDDAEDLERMGNGVASSLSSKLSQFINKSNKSKVSGDDDLPKRDDLGERRRKHELRVLSSAGIGSMDNENDAHDDDRNMILSEESPEMDGSEDEFYKQVKQERADRLAAKAVKYSREKGIPVEPEDTADGKRLITYQMEKNRGLTRSRKKLTKNPRKKYKLKHDKAKKNRLGQVREIRKPTGPYGGETTGINVGVSRSIRFKS